MSVGKEKNGTYTVQCWYREQLTGERHKKTKRGFKRKSDAVRWERDFLMKAAGSPTMKFADYCDVYRSDMLPRLKRNTWRTKEYIIRDKILPYFGDKALSDISPADVLEWQTRFISRADPKTGKPYKKTYLRTVNNILSAMLNHAVRFYGLPSNPMKRTGKIGSAKAEEMKFWTKDEYLRFAEEVMDKPGSFAIFELLYWCGIREGEALALMPEDFDFGKGLLKITKSYQRIDRQDVITSPKTAKSVRIVTMPDFVAEELSEYIELEGYEEGDPKIGKSWLGLDLALHVALGEPFWGFATKRGTVLYLCLEDTFSRVQARLQHLCDEANDNLCCVVEAERIGNGLMEQLGEFADGHDDLKMVIIDTFQTVRTPSSQTIYSADYKDMGALKAFADERGIALLAIHHTRKMGDGDVFNTISGSNGLMGCADETMVLRRKARGSSAATLNITGRDVKDQEFSVRFVDCRWELVEKVSDEELEARAVPAVVHSVIAFVNGRQAPSWCGTASDLLAAVGGDVRANVLSKYLNEHSGYMESQGVVYSRRKTEGEKLICLERRAMKVDGDDGSGI